MACAACDRIVRLRENRDPEFVAELPESWVTLADEQAYRGYCLLYLKDHAEHLERLPLDRQLRLYEDVTRVANAVARELAPVRINLACLGNLVTHVHWHVIPRYDGEPEPRHPIWVRPLEERRVVLPEGERQELIARLRQGLR
jgi:diadenosine tetraphosphate (Ap4A) HIT family hydrolase